ncbi:hypothetical protein D918_04998 [Trichuris suis]|nr:hypothetical protein D918_04998 [Trichuris suis]
MQVCRFFESSALDAFAMLKDRLPYGDGLRTPFHNPYRNALPGIGYETEDPYVTKMKAEGKEPESH